MEMELDQKKPSIIVPLDSSSLEKLYRSQFDNLQCEYFSINRKELYQIFDTGFFDYLNSEYDLRIDDYEEEVIVKQDVMQSILDNDIPRFQTSKNANFWQGLKKCLTSAINNNTVVFLFF